MVGWKTIFKIHFYNYYHKTPGVTIIKKNVGLNPLIQTNLNPQ